MRIGKFHNQKGTRRRRTQRTQEEVLPREQFCLVSADEKKMEGQRRRSQKELAEQPVWNLVSQTSHQLSSA